MKELTHGAALERIEMIIERMDPGSVVRLGDITRRVNVKGRKKEFTAAVIMLLNKYGIRYRKE